MVDFVDRRVKERAVCLVGQRLRHGSRQREHEPGELRWEVMRDGWERDSPCVTDTSESEVINVNREILGD